MIKINLFDNKVGSYIKSKGLNAEDVKLEITTSDLGFIDISRVDGLNSRIEFMAEDLKTKEGFNQYAVEMKELNRSMVEACNEYAGIADFLGIKKETEIKKLDKEQILMGTAYIQFLEEVKKQITDGFAKHIYFCCLLEDNAMKKECMFSLKKIAKGLDYEQIYGDQAGLLLDSEQSTNWEKWYPEKRSLIGYVSDNLMRENSKNMSKNIEHMNYTTSYHNIVRKQDGEESTADMIQRLSFKQHEASWSNAEFDSKKSRLLKKIAGICSEEEKRVLSAYAAYIAENKEVKNKISKVDYVNQYLGTNYTARRVDNIVSSAREKLTVRKNYAKSLGSNRILLEIVNKEFHSDFSLDELNKKLIWTKKEITKRKKLADGKSDFVILLDAINRVFGTSYYLQDNEKNYNIVLVSLIQEGLKKTTSKEIDEEFMELLLSYMDAQEKTKKYNDFIESKSKSKIQEKEETLNDIIKHNYSDTPIDFFFNYLKEHEKLAVSNFIQSATHENTKYLYLDDTFLWRFISKVMVNKHFDEVIKYKNSISPYDVFGDKSYEKEYFVHNIALNYVLNDAKNQEMYIIRDGKYGYSIGPEKSFNVTMDLMFKMEPEKAKLLYEGIEKKSEMEETLDIFPEVETVDYDYTRI